MVKNPSFEEFDNCPKRLGNFDVDVVSWSAPTLGSTDYFHECSTAMGTPKNFNGVQPADFGKGYAGLYLYAPNDYREYLQAELTQTLMKDKKYRISFYVSLAERSDFAVREFGVLFSKNALEIPIKEELSKRFIYQQPDYDYNFLEITYDDFYSDTQDWTLVHSEFVAKGTEKYMILGNFMNNAGTRLYKTKRNARQGAYYYLDMVLVEAIDQVDRANFISSESEKKNDFELDKTHVFENVLFAFDRFILLESAKKELSEIFDYMQQESSLSIEINGHTDSIGSEVYNLELSKKRAQAVAEHLISLGLSKKKIRWLGHGGTNPVGENSTYKGRQRNRRVAFVITKASSLKE